MHPSEKQFADFLTAKGRTWKSHPCRFKLGHTTYTPDFYCPEDGIYYEVKKTCSSKEIKKILRFKKAYPKITLKVVSPRGYPYYSPESDAYFSVLEKIMSILLTKDRTEVSDKEFEFLNQRAIHIKGLCRPTFNQYRLLVKTPANARPMRRAGRKSPKSRGDRQ